MNLPTLIVLALVAAALVAALAVNRRSGRKLTDCGSCSACKDREGCALANQLSLKRKPTCKSK